MQVGDFGGIGTVNQTGGKVVFGGSGLPVSLNIGNQGGNGTYNLSGGTLSFDGTGTTSFVVLGRNGPSGSDSPQNPSTGVLNLSGNGHMTVTNASLFIGSNAFNTSPTSAGVAGSGTINQTGGTLTIDSGSQLFLVCHRQRHLQPERRHTANRRLFAVRGLQQPRRNPHVQPRRRHDSGDRLASGRDRHATLVAGTTSTIDTNGIGATWSGVLSGGGGLAKAGDGTLTLSGINTYSGGTTINQGTIAVNADTGLGAATGPLTFNGGTLQFDSSFDLSPSRAITLNAANNGFAGGGTFDTNGNTSTISQGIQGAGGLTKAGAGTLTLSGPNTYTGATTVAAGTLAAGAVGTLPGMTAVTVAARHARPRWFQPIHRLAGRRRRRDPRQRHTDDRERQHQHDLLRRHVRDRRPRQGRHRNLHHRRGQPVYRRHDRQRLARWRLAILRIRPPPLSGGGPISVGSGATLGGYGSVTGDVTNSGVIAPGSATPGFSGSPMGAFTINGNYTGVGGTMAINTVLGGDGSPSDRLVISGAERPPPAAPRCT